MGDTGGAGSGPGGGSGTGPGRLLVDVATLLAAMTTPPLRQRRTSANPRARFGLSVDVTPPYSVEAGTYGFTSAPAQAAAAEVPPPA